MIMPLILCSLHNLYREKRKFSIFALGAQQRCATVLFFTRKRRMPYTLRGTLKGHNGAITSIATNRENPDLLVSASRGEQIAARVRE